jgi:asparagine synthase (glutamine-hydrolysing)
VLAPRTPGGDPLEAHRRRWAETAGAPVLARLQDVDVGTFLADDLLAQADRAAMAHGLEVRVPYLDREVAALALALPTRAKVRGLRTKAVLREAARGLLPREVANGPKRGFVAPAAAWLRGPLEPWARELLSEDRLRAQGLLRPEPVRVLLDRHAARREDLSRPIWTLMALTLWHERWSAGAPASVAPPAPLASSGA